MSTLTEGVDQVVAVLKDITLDGDQLRVWTRLEDVQPVGALVALETIKHDTDEHVIGIYLVGRQGDEYRALTSLAPLLDEVLARISPTEDTTVIGLSPTTTLRDLPALRFTTTVVI